MIHTTNGLYMQQQRKKRKKKPTPQRKRKLPARGGTYKPQLVGKVAPPELLKWNRTNPERMAWMAISSNAIKINAMTNRMNRM